MSRRVRLSTSEARRIALAAQGVDRARPEGKPDKRHFRRVMQSLAVLQLDYVNVLIPAHYLIIWSRLGAYDCASFDRYLYGSGEFTEQWAHEASIVPTDAWPLLEYRRRDHKMSSYNPLRNLRDRSDYLAAALEQVRQEGALCASDLPAVPGPKRKPGDWHRSIPRWALEFHFARGNLAVARRRKNFQRVYDLPERVVPDEHLERAWSTEDAHRELLRRASVALGVATVRDLADYFRMSPRDAAPRVPELVDMGALKPVEVEGWTEPGYLARGARLPRSIETASLLSPFDPIVWYRPRAERLFDFHYRIEIYVPQAKRRWGYYVLPFRMGERIVARVDLKADRKQRCLKVLAAHEEPGIDKRACTQRLANELDALRDWLALENIEVCSDSRFSESLAADIRA